MIPKLLLADDSVTIQRVIELTFADENVQVFAVGDGQQAIDRLQVDRPDIVLADIGMPQRDGYEVAAFIKGDPSLAHIPVLLLTGAFEPVDEVRARAVGCDGVLVKPFEPQMVISRVRDLLAGHRTPDAPLESETFGRPPAIPGAPQTELADMPPVAAPSEASGMSLEDYFDRLDAALASKGVPARANNSAPAAPPQASAAPPAPPPSTPEPAIILEGVTPATGPVPHRDPLEDFDLSGWDPSTGADVAPAAPAAAIPVAPAIEAAPPAIELPPSLESVPATAAAPAPPVLAPPETWQIPSLQEAFAALLSAEQGQPIAPVTPHLDPNSNELIEEVARRVITRMGDGTMRSAVLDAAERLVREEIDRIKNTR